MPFLNAVYLESLRLHTVSAFFISRQCVQDTIVNGYKIPAGMMIIIPTPGVNLSAEIWSNPLHFKPERLKFK